MKKSNRNFYEREEVTELPDDLKYNQDYNPVGVNIFNLDNFRNLKLQSLDYSFFNQLERDEDSFEVIISKPRLKKQIRVGLTCLIIIFLVMVCSKFISLNVDDFFMAFDIIVGDEETKLVNSIIEFLDNYLNLICKALIIVDLVIMAISFLATKSYFSLKDSKRFAIILDNYGFYKVDIDSSKRFKNELNLLYFVKFVDTFMKNSLEDRVESVSYFSTYSKSMKSKKFYVLDLPNDSINFSNAYDLEFCRKDFKKKDYLRLVEYLDETEDSGYED